MTQQIQFQDRDMAILLGLFESRIMTAAHVAALFFDGKTEATKKRLQKIKAAGLIGERKRRVNEKSILFLTRKGYGLLQKNELLRPFPQLSASTFEKRANVSELTIRHELEVMDVKAAFHSAGYSPGVVLPSMLAALGAAEGKRPTLVIKVDAHTTSIAILNDDTLQLFRTLENSRGVTISGEQLAEEVYPSVVFFQDTYHLNIERIYVAGLSEAGGAAPALRAQTGADVQELVSASQLGASAGGSVPRWRMAGVVGALVS